MIGRLALLIACSGAVAAEEPKFSGGNGSSCEEAVVPIVREPATMVEAERHWLEKTYGGGSLVRQALGESRDGKRRFDLILWRKPDGQTVDICFDITTVFEDTIRQIEVEDADHWRDTHFRAEGPVVAQMQAVFLDNWIKATGVVLHGPDYFPALKTAGAGSASTTAPSSSTTRRTSTSTTPGSPPG